MAVGKGSMARAVRAAETIPADGKKNSTVAAGVISGGSVAGVMTGEGSETKEENKVAGQTRKKASGSKKKPLVEAEKKLEETKTEEIKTEETKNIEGAGIVYQPSYQVLNRNASENETFQVGEAMPIYYY